MKPVIVSLMLFSFTDVNATAQYPDKLIYNGKEYALHTNPLEFYFEKHPDKKPKTEVMSTALWRGYVATFEIEEGQLYVKDVQIQVWRKNGEDVAWRSVIKDIFPDKEVKAGWFTGLLVLPYGKLVNYVHMGYGSTYKNYLILEINEGNLQQEKQFNYKKYEQFKEEQFAEFKKTEEYRRLVEELSKEGDNSPEFIDSFLKDFVVQYTSKILTPSKD